MINSFKIMDLMRYDIDKKCFVLAQLQPEVEYWPGTDVVKSRNNAFEWQGQPSHLTRRGAPNISNSVTPGRAFTIYSRARASK